MDPAGVTGGQYRESWNRRRKQPRGGRGGGPDRSTISASGGHPRGVVWVATLQRGGGASRWCTILTIANLHYQRAKPSPLWSRLCPEIRIGRGLARIPQILRGKAPCAAAAARPRLARRVVAPHGRGRWWRERPPVFRRWCATSGGKGGQASGHLSPALKGGGRSLHSDPWREGHRAPLRARRINRLVRPSTPAGQVAGRRCPGPGPRHPGLRHGRVGRGRGDEEAGGSFPRSGVRRGRSPSPAPMYYIG